MYSPIYKMEYENNLSEDHPNWVDVDIEKVCRICLQPDDELLLIFDELNSYNKISLADMITECSNCRVERHDDYPHQICLKCIEVLKIAYNFRLKCKQSHKIAKLVLNNGIEPRIAIIDNDNLPPLDKFTQTEVLTFFPCEKCDEKFLTMEKLRTHRYYNHKGTSHECRVCKKSFRRIGYLKNHLAFYHPELGYVNNNECPICFKKFGRTEHLRRHQVKVHNQKFGNPTKISKVGNKTSEIDDSVTDDTIKKNICEVCSKEYETENELKNHSCSEQFQLSFKCKETNIMDVQENSFENDALELHTTDEQTDDEDLTPLSVLRKEYESEKKIEIEKNDDLNATVKIQKQNDLKAKRKKVEIEKKNDATVKKQQQNDLNSTVKITKSKDQKKIKNSTSQKLTKTGYCCNVCQKMFNRADHLRRHENSHFNIRPFDCIYCNKTYSRSENLNNHMTRSHSDKQPYKCEICNKGFPRIDIYRKHKNHCTTGQQENLVTEKKQNPKIKKPKSYVCEICKKGFTTERHHQIHVNNHNSKMFSCKFCKIVHKTKAEAAEHAKTHDNPKPYLCSECGLRFVRNDYLIIHMRRHNGEKPYKCKFCDKGFPRATDLTVHERYHTGEKSHLCVTCGKGFQRAYNLVVHTRVHTGERPYKCSYCSKSFAQGNDLKAHIRRHTGERFRCEICNEGFIQAYHLTQHKKTVHGIDQPSHIRRLEKIKPKRTEEQKQEEETDIKNELSNSENTSEHKENDYSTITFLNTDKRITISDLYTTINSNGSEENFA